MDPYYEKMKEARKEVKYDSAIKEGEEEEEQEVEKKKKDDKPLISPNCCLLF